MSTDYVTKEKQSTEISEETWDRFSGYLEELTRESSILEKELAEKKQKRQAGEEATGIETEAAAEPATDAQFPQSVADEDSSDRIFTKAEETIRQHSSNLHSLKKDLNSLLGELRDFRKARTDLESDLYRSVS